MSNISYDDFIKKYGIAINGLSQRISLNNGMKIADENLAKRLYQDALKNQVDMNDMTRAVANFYQGGVTGQIKMKDYVEKYK
ncbi:MAG: hypothetical protein IJS47_06970 [Clostridia bacterium]|nr:hypothetical protein [Clostridia bacterium]